MSYLQALLYGVIQGTTEWLPISSTAHIRFIPALLHWPDPGAAFTAISQFGTLFAALFYFRQDIMAILFGAKEGYGIEEGASRRLLVPILIGTIPVVVAGFAFRHQISGPMRSLWVVAGSMVFFALILAIAERCSKVQRSIQTVTITDGLLVGLGQMMALIPGASRSGTTITAALFAGFERSAAARFSFLLSLPAVAAAGILEAYQARAAIMASNMLGPTLVATAVSFVFGLASIHWLLSFLKTRSTVVFIVYRLLVGGAILAMLATHQIAPF